jgi:HEAT repeat protein
LLAVVLLVGVALAGWVWFEYYRFREPVYQGRFLSLWMLDLNSPDARTRQQAEAVIRGVDEKAIPTLAWALAHRDPLLKRPLAALEGHLPRFVTSPLHRAIRPYDALMLRRAAAHALNLVNPPPLAALPALASALRDADHRVWSNAAAVLAKLGPAGAAVLVQALGQDDDELQRHALSVLDLRRMDTNAAVPALLALLAHGRGLTPMAAGQALNTLGPAAIPHLLGLLATGDEDGRFLASQALIELGSKDFNALVAMIEALPRQTPVVRRELAQGLSQMHPFTRRAAWGLAKALQDSDHEVRLAAAAGLRQVLPWVDTSVPSLIEALENREPEVRRLAAGVLGDLGPVARAAVPALSRKLDDPDEAVRRQVGEALRLIASEPPRAPAPQAN